MSYTLRGRLESRLAALAVPLLVGVALAAALPAWWPMELAGAMAGLLLALMAVGLSQATGQDYWDPIGSVVIGVLLCVVAVVLAWITHGLLIGEGATPEDKQRALELARGVPGVAAVTQLLTLHLGPDVVVLAMKVAFDPSLSVEKVEEVTNAIEAKVRAAMPQMRKIFIEADSRGDLRGVAEAR